MVAIDKMDLFRLLLLLPSSTQFIPHSKEGLLAVRKAKCLAQEYDNTLARACKVIIRSRPQHTEYFNA